FAARPAVIRDEIDRAALDTAGFRFAKLLDYRDPQFLPGGAKYFDVPVLLALGAPHRLWLAGEKKFPEIATESYRRSDDSNQLSVFHGKLSNKESAAVEWLLRSPSSH